MFKGNQKAFTLVELIVVITILAILGTIGFISLQGFTKNARQSSRISDLGSIEKSLDYHKITNNRFPAPTNPINISFSGSTVWQQGTFGEATRNISQKISKVPLDPLTKNEYTYSVSNTGQEYQLGAMSETLIVANSLAPQTYADNGYFVMTRGNYNSKISTVRQGSMIYILGIPTLLTNSLTGATVQDLFDNDRFSIKQSNNLPASYSNTLPNNQSYTGSTNFKPSKLLVLGKVDPVIYAGLESTLGDSSVKESIGNQIVGYYKNTNISSFSEYSDLLAAQGAGEGKYFNYLLKGEIGGLKSEYSTINYTSASTTTTPISTPSYSSGAFVSTWNTGTDSFLILPLSFDTGNSVNIQYSNIDTPSLSGSLLNQTTDYIRVNFPSAGKYRLVVTGAAKGFSFANSASRYPEKIVSVEQWGQLGLLTLNSAFNGSTNLVSVPNNTLGLEGVANMSSMFQNASKFNSSLSNWSLTGVTLVNNMFNSATVFNQDLSGWNTSNITSMTGMFRNADAFNSNISSWNLSKVTNMSQFLLSADIYNQNLSTLNTSNVTSCASFYGSTPAWVLPKPPFPNCTP